MMKYRVVCVALLALSCKSTETIAPSLGALRVSAAMSGFDQDRDGVVIALDDTTRVALPSNGTYLFTGVVAGSHRVGLEGLVANCVTSGAVDRSVTIGSDTVAVSFTILCSKVPLAASGLIAFARGDSDHTWDLWVMNADGTGETQVRESPNVSEFAPAWTQDGKHILFTTYDTQTGAAILAEIDPTGTGYVALADSAYSPSVAPDGQHVAFAKDVTGAGAFDIWIMDIDGKNQQPLTSDTAYEDHPSWSPDGSQIVFERGYRLYVMNADGSNPHKISASDAIEDRWPSWSPDGTKILFVRRGFGTDHVYAIGPDGSALTPVTSGPYNDDFPAWSSDGTHILFSSGRGSVLSVWSALPDGTNVVRLTVGPPTPYDSYPAASR